MAIPRSRSEANTQTGRTEHIDPLVVRINRDLVDYLAIESEPHDHRLMGQGFKVRQEAVVVTFASAQTATLLVKRQPGDQQQCDFFERNGFIVLAMGVNEVKRAIIWVRARPIVRCLGTLEPGAQRLGVDLGRQTLEERDTARRNLAVLSNPVCEMGRDLLASQTTRTGILLTEGGQNLVAKLCFRLAHIRTIVTPQPKGSTGQVIRGMA